MNKSEWTLHVSYPGSRGAKGRNKPLGPVVQKPINANLGLNFNPRLLCVVQS